MANMGNLQDMVRTGITDQQQNISDQKEQLNALLNKPKQTDLTPLMALADAWSGQPGSNLAGAYKSMRPQDDDAKANALKQQLMQQEQGLLGKQMALLKLTQKKTEGSSPAIIGPAQKMVDKEFGKDYNKFWLQGEYADAEKGVEQLRGVSELLSDKSKNLTGLDVKYNPLRKIFNQESVDAQESVEEVVQRNLRIVLGAQFTEKEGERLISRAYNPALDEEVNKKRVDRLLMQMQKALDAKRDAATFYEKNGTLQGFDTSRLYKRGEFTDQFEKDIRWGLDEKESKKPSIEKGTVDDGYEFQGGDPSDQNNWKEI